MQFIVKSCENAAFSLFWENSFAKIALTHIEGIPAIWHKFHLLTIAGRVSIAMYSFSILEKNTQIN